MIAVAILALGMGVYLGVERERWASHNRRLAEFHAESERYGRRNAIHEAEMAVSAERNDDRWARRVRDLRSWGFPVPSAPEAAENHRLVSAKQYRASAAARPRWIAYHAEMKQAYTQAAIRPWEPIPPHPSPPGGVPEFEVYAHFRVDAYRPAESWWGRLLLMMPGARKSDGRP